jgi:hypothetical protein
VPRCGSRLAGVVGLALTGLALTVTGCGNVLPLGPTPAATPTPRHLAAAIVMQPGLGQPGAPPGGCPAGSVALSGPGTPTITAASGSTSTTSRLCFRQLGKPVTFTSAGVTLYHQLAGSEPVQHPATWELRITLSTPEAAALTAVTAKVAGTRDQIAILIAGKTWGLPFTRQPLTNGQFAIAVHNRSQALQLQRILLQPA